MESSVFLLLQDEIDQLKQLNWMLSDDAPIFDDEVDPEYRAMFNAVEDCHQADDVIVFPDGPYLFINYLVGDWQEFLGFHFKKFKAAGFEKLCIYISADEEELYLISDNGQLKQFNPRKVKLTVEDKLPYKKELQNSSDITTVAKLAKQLEQLGSE